MAEIKIKKGINLNLKGAITDTAITNTSCKNFAITPDDFTGVVPRLDVKEGDKVDAGSTIYHDKSHPEVKVTSPIAGKVKAIVRGERRKIEAIIIEADGSDRARTFDVKSAARDTLLESGLWCAMRQRPYDIVPDPNVKPRDIFITAFDSAPLAPDFALLLKGKEKYLQTGIEVLATLTDGDVYLGCRPKWIPEVKGCIVNTFAGPHPAGNAGVQIANVKPVNKGETVWTLDAVTAARIGELFSTGKVPFDTIVAITGESVRNPHYARCTMGCSIASLTGNEIDNPDNCRIVSGNLLTGSHVAADGYLRFPYRQLSAITEVRNPADFLGWASLSPKRFSIYHSFTRWLLGRGKPATPDAKINGGERAIIMSGEYDRMLPMDILGEYLIKAIIAFDIDKMEQLGIYEIAPEDFALCEFADTSKLPLQKIIREGLDKLYKEMN